MRPSLLRSQLRLLLREPTLRLGALVLLLCFGYALARGRAWALADAEQLARVQHDVDAEVGKKREEVADVEAGRVRAEERPFAGSPLDYKVAAALPPGPLAALATGQRDLAASVTQVTPWGRSDALLTRQSLADPEQLQAGTFDAAFVVVYLLPLLVIGLTFDLLAGERERGTLRLVLSQPISPAGFLLAKLAARLVVILALLGLFGVAAAAALGTGVTAGLLAWIAVAAVYALFWSALAFAVNTRGRSSAANAMTLAGAWVSLVLVLPAAINTVVEQALPLPSRMVLIGELRAAENRAAAWIHDHPELTGDDVFAWARAHYRVQRAVEEETAPRFAAFAARLEARTELVRASSWVSPPVLVHEALSELAGTGPARHAAFGAQVLAFVDSLRGEMAPRLYAGRRLTAGEYDALPRFTFVEEEPAQVAVRLVPPLGLLVVASAGLLLWGVLRLRRGEPPVRGPKVG
ncbi:ABC-2 type transport system permease protein [Nannocystis exedens]|uniref:ABC-2 type transport system permease protein n=1 Tax=Nannocystis exedens TaxID=54 RepID=A0A1I2HLP2_9BACT|nr:DUF3526 domain-containing protein [Nannocystis exedens]PCC69349.1 ABC transporter permease [Nannocystis exedens]SFF31054.1 ABC-2 type transport system permease protein [Nannocystis exedens]